MFTKTISNINRNKIIKFTYLNISGISNLYKTEIIKELGLASNNWIGLSETWSERDLISCYGLKNFNSIVSPAVKVNSKGRAKGGLVLWNNVDTTTLVQIIHKDSNCIIARYYLKDSNKNVIIAVNYYAPSLSKEDVEEGLYNLEKVIHNYANEPVFIAGDFNGRIGQLDGHPLISSNDYLLHSRTSADEKSNPRGHQLLQFCEENELVVLNGRTNSDSIGEFTFVETTGTSVIDYFMINPLAIDFVRDMEVVNTSCSAHSALQLLLACEVVPRKSVVYEHPKIIFKTNKVENFQERFQSNLTYFSNILSYQSFHDCLFHSALECRMVQRQSSRGCSQPWYDLECIQHKTFLNKALKAAKLARWNTGERMDYIAAKKQYKTTIKSKAKAHWEEKIEMLNRVHSPNQFWSTVRKINNCILPCNNIEESEWIKFYDKTLPKRQISNKIYVDVTRQIDENFTMDELNTALKQAKNNKSSGPDGICNEILKNLPLGGKVFLLAVYNDIWKTEKLPPDWSTSSTVMIHKKGPKEQPDNYRPISLLSCPLKIMTQMMHNRLYHWAEYSGILPESQAGFRKSRSCHENIFTLKAAIDVRLRKKKRKLFAFFIDFSRAFPSINHQKLWDKLFSLGVSAKFIRWLRNLYQTSNMKIRLQGNNLSSPIDITEGVLQGEVLSPLLFNIYISEVETILKEAEGIGVNISSTEQIHMLAYADDMVVLSESAHGLKMKIEALENYFETLSLKVNISKTKILVFRRGGRVSKKFHFFYKGQEIELVRKYTYLGVLFSSSGKFRDAAQSFQTNGKKAIGALWNTLTKGKINAWESFLNLYESCIKPTALYCADVWGPSYLHEIERVQVTYFKKLLALNRRTPDAIVRMECGIYHMQLSVIKKMLETWRRYSQLPGERYAKKYLVRMTHLCNENQLENSWVNYLKVILEQFAPALSINSNVAEISNARWNNKVDYILGNVRDWLWNRDWEWLSSHTKYMYYMDMLPNKGLPAKHLSMEMSIMKKRVLSQCRTNSSYVRINGVNYTLSGSCCLCNCEIDSPLHVLLDCVAHLASRFYLSATYQYEMNYKLLAIENKSHANAIYNFISTCFSRRDLAL